MSVVKNSSKSREQLLNQGRPKTLSGLMNLYESNHQRLVRLLGDESPVIDSAISKSRLDHDLYLTVMDRAPFTTEFELTYRFADRRPAPSAIVRMYHDVEIAEAVACDGHERLTQWHQINPKIGVYTRQRWERNLLLNKWLAFCLARGHGFHLAARPRVLDAEVFP